MIGLRTGFRIAKHYLVGSRQQSGEAARLFKLAADKFEKALAFSHDDQNVLNKYADTLCHHAGFGPTGPKKSRSTI